jgi:hypothetical protein
MKMNLEDAIRILEIEKGVAELDLSNDEGNLHTEDFVNALDVVFSFIADVLSIMKIGKGVK